MKIVYKLTSLARWFDFQDKTNIFILFISIIFIFIFGLYSGVLIFMLWAIIREFLPEESKGSLIFAFVLLFLIVYLHLSVSILILLWLLLVFRVVSKTSGRFTTIFDAVVISSLSMYLGLEKSNLLFVIFAGIAFWIDYRYNPLALFSFIGSLVNILFFVLHFLFFNYVFEEFEFTYLFKIMIASAIYYILVSYIFTPQKVKDDLGHQIDFDQIYTMKYFLLTLSIASIMSIDYDHHILIFALDAIVIASVVYQKTRSSISSSKESS